MGQPISGNHSIEVIAFVIEFEQPFSNSTLERLITLKEALKKDYPVFSPTNVTQFKIENEKISSSSNSIGGVFLQKLTEEGRPDWTLRAQANSIIVSCFGFNYDSWRDTCSKAITDLISAAKFGFDDKNPLASLALQVIDRFVESEKESYEFSQVFNLSSRYITKQASESGALWHIHQGWFQGVSEISDAKNLNVLNLSTNDTPAGIITTIDHVGKINFISSRKASDATDEELLSAAFSYLHDQNKHIVSELLNPEQCKAIDIC